MFFGGGITYQHANSLETAIFNEGSQQWTRSADLDIDLYKIFCYLIDDGKTIMAISGNKRVRAAIS